MCDLARYFSAYKTIRVYHLAPRRWCAWRARKYLNIKTTVGSVSQGTGRRIRGIVMSDFEIPLLIIFLPARPPLDEELDYVAHLGRIAARTRMDSL